MGSMETVTFIVTALIAVGLFGAGICISLKKTPKATVVTSVFGFAFLALVLLHVSKFKHVNGFGFEAETWDEKQVEAGKLVDQLSALSDSLSQQVALLASRLSTAHGLTVPELGELIEQTEKQLTAASIPKNR